MASPSLVTRAPGRAAALLLAGLLGLACDPRYWVCAPADRARLALLPARLSQTGLFADLAAERLAAGVWPYRPRFALWSDGAEKRRWLWLPPGRSIDTSRMDSWVFPEGTKLWKEFTRDGVRVETRLLAKVGPGEADWIGLAYVWSPDGLDAIAAPDGAEDARGTPHDVPASAECMGCHGGRRSRVLGFSALQLAGQAEPGEMDLAGASRAGWLSQPPAGELALPGDETERAALGYLHANCSHCHNQDRPPSQSGRCFDPRNGLDFFLASDHLGAVAETATYRTVVGKAITPGRPDDSKLVELLSHRGFFRQMPPLATEEVDATAVALVRRWIAGMERRP
jgi:hypothetical protein